VQAAATASAMRPAQRGRRPERAWEAAGAGAGVGDAARHSAGGDGGKIWQPVGVVCAPSAWDLGVFAMRERKETAVIKQGALAPVGGFHRC
jgi:hypothetical protein